MLEHGGRLRAAAKRWGIPLGDWLDLSTGIAPHGYPVPPPSAYSWRCLPEDDDGLEAAAAAYYGSTRLLALPGSQAAIMALPSLRPRGTTAILSPTYGEYAAAWQAAGHAVRFFVPDELENVAAACDAVMVANPNNPTGARFDRARLLDAARMLQARGGKLIVDEAFADAEGEESLATIAGSHDAPNLVVLRSLGKFFGLAGARVGFAIGRSAVLERLAEAVGPWAVAHPAREAARAAFADVAWQREQRERLHSASARLERLLMDAGLGASSGTALFRYLATPSAPALADALARQGVLVRCFTEPFALRFGLPGSEAEWGRLAQALGSAVGGCD